MPYGHIFDARLRFPLRAAPTRPQAPQGPPNTPRLYLPEHVYNYSAGRGAGGRAAGPSQRRGSLGLEVSTLFTLISLRAFWEISLLRY